MRNSTKLLLVALAAVIALIIGAGAASALRSILLSPGGTVRATSTALTFTEEASNFRIICEVVLTITLNSRIAKRAAAAIGGATNAEIRLCRGANVRVLAPEARNPWPVTYVSFVGTLPNITSVTIQIERVGFLLESFFEIGRCLYGGTIQGTTVGLPTITEIRVRENREIPLASQALSGIECPANGFFRGSFRLSTSQRMTLV